MVPTTRQYLRGINLQQIYVKIGFVFFILILWYLLSNLIAKYNLIQKAVLLLVYYFILNIIFNYGRMIIIYFYRRKQKLAVDHADNFTLGIGRVSFALNHVIFVLVFIHVVFVNIWTLVTSLSIVAVALVLIFKDYLANFMNGILMMFSSDFQLRHYIKVGEFKGRIQNITFEHIELKTDEGDIVYIPNTLVYNKEVINYSLNKVKAVIFTLSLPKEMFRGYETCKKKIRNRLLKGFPELINSESDISFILGDVTAGEAKMRVEVNVKRYSYAIDEQIRHAVYEEVIREMEKRQN